MSHNLFDKKYFQKEDNIDLKEILTKFYRNFKFTENKYPIEEGIQPLSLENINLLYDQQDQVRGHDQWQEVCQKTLSNISPDFRFTHVLKKITKDQTLEVEELIQCYHVLNSYKSLKNQLPIAGTTGIPVIDLNRALKEWHKECETLFDFKTNSLITYKHKDLKPIDKRIQETSKELRVRLSKISNEWQKNELLQQNEFDVFNDKFVLPVRSDRFTGNLGRIIHRSKTGSTLFVEPHTLREISNKLEELKAELEREIFKILNRLTSHLGLKYHEMQNVFHYMLTLDSAFGRLKTEIQFSLTRPLMNTKGHLEITNIFNPLIEGPVKNSLKIKKSSNGLLISGPNTGGKTVLLKSICLCIILPHLGFKVPADDANLPYFKDVYFMSHDNQSLMDGLSSFSSEAMDYLKTVNGLENDNSVIFIDEIFNTTSSVEASQLAVALIKELSNRKAKTFISSHHESLKEIIFEGGLLESGHMGFKKESNTPTYVFHHGSPGKSFAKEVFLKLEKDVLEFPDITRWLDNKYRTTAELDSRIQSLDEIKEDSLKVKAEYEELLSEIQREKENVKNILSIEKANLQSEFDKKWNQLKKETLDLTEKVKKGELKNIVKVTSELSKMKKEKERGVEAIKIATDAIIDPQAGDRVFIAPFNKDGKILKLNKTKAYVESGSLKSWVKITDLYKPGTQNKGQQQVTINIQKNQEGRGLQLDARGMRR
ncbi:MAG: hypothetical protein NXH75_05700, partial [Halobacteriovoraceae bacterium]|nr:hypothetical protein [Halobacteriovoraceae bacterium]